jgi:hypothetical protein
MKKIILILTTIFVLPSCKAQSSKREIAYNGFDFTNEILGFSSNEATDSTNMINFELYYMDSTKIFLGHARGFMIHKKGIKYWFNYAQKEYKEIGEYSNKNYGYSNASEKLEGKDRYLLNDFDKWMFFVDKQYLKKVAGTGEWDANDPNLGKPLPPEYYEKENIEIEELLLEQKAGEKVWYIIDKKKFKTDEYGNRVKWQDAYGLWHDGDKYWDEELKHTKIKQYAIMK